MSKCKKWLCQIQKANFFMDFHKYIMLDILCTTYIRLEIRFKSYQRSFIPFKSLILLVQEGKCVPQMAGRTIWPSPQFCPQIDFFLKFIQKSEFFMYFYPKNVLIDFFSILHLYSALKGLKLISKLTICIKFEFQCQTNHGPEWNMEFSILIQTPFQHFPNFWALKMSDFATKFSHLS